MALYIYINYIIHKKMSYLRLSFLAHVDVLFLTLH